MRTVLAASVVQYNSTFLTSIMNPIKTLLIERLDQACLFPPGEEMQWCNMRTVSADPVLGKQWHSTETSRVCFHQEKGCNGVTCVLSRFVQCSGPGKSYLSPYLPANLLSSVFVYHFITLHPSLPSLAGPPILLTVYLLGSHTKLDTKLLEYFVNEK